MWSNIPGALHPPPRLVLWDVVSYVVGHKLLIGDRFQAARFLKLDHKNPVIQLYERSAFVGALLRREPCQQTCYKRPWWPAPTAPPGGGQVGAPAFSA